MFRSLSITVLFAILLELSIGSECGDRYHDYRGCVHTGHNAEECDVWTRVALNGASYWGDDEFITQDEAAANGIGDHNYCRNPAGKRYGPWCYEKGKNKHKIYCTVNSHNCVFTRPELDPSCPEYSPYTPPDDDDDNTDSGGGGDTDGSDDLPIPRVSNLKEGISVDIPCKVSCSGGYWSSTPPQSHVTSEGVLRIERVVSDTAGSWGCTCGGKSYVHQVTVCAMVVTTPCSSYGGSWFEEVAYPTCDNAVNRLSCDPDGGKSDDGSADAQARNEDDCTGLNCGFCGDQPLICGILSFTGAAVIAASVFFVWKAMKWRRAANKASSTATLSANLTALSTLQSMRGLQLPRDVYAAKPDGTYLTLHPPTGYDIQQYLNMTSGSLPPLGSNSLMPPDMSRATSMTDVGHLRELRRDGGIGRIRSKEDGTVLSSSNIACEPRQFDGTMRFSELGESGDAGSMGFDTTRRRIREFKNEEFGPRDDTLFENIAPPPQDPTMIEHGDVDTGLFEHEEKSIREAQYGEGDHDMRDATIFDKYYDDNIETWSMENEIPI